MTGRAALLTGSHAYGTPHAGSDVDLVVFLPQAEASILERLGRRRELLNDEHYRGITSVHFGDLNLILVTDQEEFDTWSKVTRDLVARKPVTRAEAVKAFDALREERA